jgi:hypothetical protein
MQVVQPAILQGIQLPLASRNKFKVSSQTAQIGRVSLHSLQPEIPHPLHNPVT